ncbi:NADP-dependent oxidoreductase [Kitasatospora brasiliensis]|uniref:NADP-dependent oxidoreductase n=1 Tax=Kitasatospora brasiliensis TaxID=3058040 RepID=UPI00292F29E4|nr:NADP-dependent oxidoreductase [Kitasatospora sp. K002]
MRAISQQDVYGGPEVLKEIELPVPKPGPGQVLVRVRAAGVNPTDWKGRARKGWFEQPPRVLGWDLSGTVEEVGFGVALFQPGDEVFGMLPYPHGVGSHAEYAVGPARAFARKPAGIDHVQAAALPLAALTAYQALVDTADVRPGQHVLVHAAAGGVGHLAVQLAKHLGARVTGTASAAKHDFVRSLGADDMIDYRTVDFRDTVRDVDTALVPLIDETRIRTVDVLRPGGTLVALLPGATEDELAAAARRGIRYTPMLVEHDHTGMTAIADLAAKGVLRAHVQEVIPLSEAARAHTLGEEGHVTGKLVLVP